MSEQKSTPVLSDTELLECVNESGFPFELQVGRELASIGFDVQLSHRFLDRGKKRDAEMDIVAKSGGISPTERGASVHHSLRLAVECRDTSQPLVFFGLPDSGAPLLPDKMDPDWPYCWIDTSRDAGIPNKFSAIAFDETRSTLFRKQYHHQFSGPARFSTVTTIEWQNKRAKLHVTDRLRSTLSNFGVFVEDSRAMWTNLARSPGELERLLGGTPSIELTFLLVVHAGEQYQYSLDQAALVRSRRTSLFARFHSERGVEFFVVDFVRYDSLREVLKEIQNSYALLVGHVLPTVLASRAA